MIRWNDTIAESEVLWLADRSEGYDVRLDALVVRKLDGCVLYVSASGCSCWDGDAEIDEMVDLRHALGPLGVPANVRDEAFHALCEQHGIAPTRAGDVP